MRQKQWLLVLRSETVASSGYNFHDENLITNDPTQRLSCASQHLHQRISSEQSNKYNWFLNGPRHYDS